MVEEAGEILEAHILTSLSQNTKHLVMIGDHKQLRPKIESYSLAVQSGRGYNLNVSLFERLVLSGTPHSTLAVQHRMHPDISRLIKHTYPDLQDHPSVSTRPAVKGVQTRVVLINHNKPELQESQASKGLWRASAEHQSKVNEYEVELSVAVVKYLLQQGYRAEQLVLLTPYLGQLLELQRALSKEVQVLLNDMDLRDLRNAALPAATSDLNKSSSSSSKDKAAAAGGSSGAVRVATIDNYQGEEADVVVVSLVRSNSRGNVGFLREPERINVVLSRARDGLIMMGNVTTLRNASSSEARKHWGVVVDQLDAAGLVYSGFPAVCQQHGRQILPLLDTAEAFAKQTPNGGCTLPCHATLPCGHTCRLRCHAYDLDHTSQRCTELVYGLCDAGHLTTKQCSAKEAVCSTCVEIRRVQEEEKKDLQKLVSVGVPCGMGSAGNTLVQVLGVGMAGTCWWLRAYI